MCTVIPITKTLGPRGMTCPSLLRAERILRLMVLALGMAKLQALNACETDEINQVRWIAEIPDANLSNDGGPVTNGGESGIRTHVTLSSKHAFQACAFSHSAISPAKLREERLAIPEALPHALSQLSQNPARASFHSMGVRL